MFWPIRFQRIADYPLASAVRRRGSPRAPLDEQDEERSLRELAERDALGGHAYGCSTCLDDSSGLDRAPDTRRPFAAGGTCSSSWGRHGKRRLRRCG